MNMLLGSNPDDDYWNNENPMFDRIKFHEEELEI